MAKTITKKMVATAIVNLLEDNFNEKQEVIAVVDNDEDMVITIESAIEFLNHEIELLSKKKSSKTSEKTLKENKVIKDEIVSVLAGADDPMTVTEILAKGNFEAKVSNQKLSAMLRQMVADGIVDKSTEKKVSKFSLV